MENIKEVYFDQWCYKCVNKNINEWDDPCNECLEYPGREYSHKPEFYKEKDNAINRTE